MNCHISNRHPKHLYMKNRQVVLCEGVTGYEDFQELIDKYTSLREKCYHLAREKPELMGEYAWLRNALDDTDIRMDVVPDGINCYGSAYTTQTMDHEWFDFTIPFEMI